MRSFVALSLLALLLAADVLRPSGAEAVTWQVSVQNFVFVPANLTIAPGDVVRWNWVNGIHTTTSGPAGSPNGLWDAPIDLGNTFFQRTFNTSGTFQYHCTFHGATGMTGTIIVGTPNFPPVVQNPGTQNGEELTPFEVTVTATDADGNPLTMSDLGTHPAWSTFVDNGDGTCTFSGTPQLGQAGTYPVSVRASDGIGTDTENFNIVIAELPTIVNLTAGGFTPSAVTIQIGDRVRWIKVAGGNHTTTNGTGLADPQAGTIWDAELRAASPQFTFQFNTAGTFPYFCRAHAAETGTVTVEPLPTCSIAGPDPVCATSAGNAYTATVAPVGGTVTYAWSISGNGSIIGSTTGASVSVTAGATGSFLLTLNGNRNGTAFQCTKTVTVNAVPTCTVSGPDPVNAGSAGHAYTATVAPSGGTVTYAWSIGGNGTLVGSTTGSSVTVDAGAAGSFTLTLNVTRNGCPSSCQKVVTVSPTGTVAATILVQGFEFSPGTVIVNPGQQVKWQWVNGAHTTTSGYSSDPSHNPGALWDVGLDTLQQSFIRQFDEPGYYPFFCRPHEPHGMRGAVVVAATTSVGDGSRSGPRLLPSPNPFQERVALVVELPEERRVTLDIYDLSGRKVLGLLKAELPAGIHRVTWGGWDDHHQPVVPGVYFARLEAGAGRVLVQKLFKAP